MVAISAVDELLLSMFTLKIFCLDLEANMIQSSSPLKYNKSQLSQTNHAMLLVMVNVMVNKVLGAQCHNLATAELRCQHL